MLRSKGSINPTVNLPRLPYKHSTKLQTPPTEFAKENPTLRPDVEELKAPDEIKDDETEPSTEFDNYVDVGAMSEDETIPDIQEDVLSAIQPDKSAEAEAAPGSVFERRLACPNGCGNFFYVKSALQKHIRYDCGKVYPRHTFRYKCAYCDSRSEYSYSIMRHISKHHRMQKVHVIDTWLKRILEKKETPKKVRDPNEASKSEVESVKRHECPNKCGITFDHVSNISRHIRKTCTKVQRYLCPYCKYRTRTYLLIKKHIEVNHKHSKVCAINFFTKQIVYKEIRRRIKLGKKNPNEASTVASEETPEGKKPKKRFQCPNGCGMAFNFEHTMENHQRFVCGKMCYKCPYCPKKCRQEWGTITHIRHRHPDRREFVIDFRRKKVIYEINGRKYLEDFDSIEDKKVREEYERGKNDAAVRPKKESVRNFQCPHCGKMCKHGWNLDQHIKFRHPNVARPQRLPQPLPVQLPIQLPSSSQDYELDSKDEKIEESLPEVSSQAESSFDETGTFSENSNLEEESQIESGPATSQQRRNFLCPNNCGSLIKYEHNLARHLRNVCGKHKSLECPFCPFRSRNNIVMNKHIKQSHARKENFVLVGDENREMTSDVKVEEIEIDNPLE